MNLSRRALLVASPMLASGLAAARPASGLPDNPPPPPFSGLRPRRELHVGIGGDDRGSGSAAEPLATIQAAVDRASPGTAILVRAGRYAEAVRFPSRAGGERDAPIWLRSADGIGAAVVSPPDRQSGVKGLGVRNIVVDGLAIRGGVNGVQFSQSGGDFRHLCERLVIRNCRIRNAREDGIKISQATSVWVLDNAVEDCGDQCVDYVNVWTGVISGNRLSGARKAAAVFAKGGSKRVWIVGNQISGLRGRTVAGIGLGGHTGEGFARPGSPVAELQGAVVRSNRVRDVQSYALVTLGAEDVLVEDNDLDSLAGEPGQVSAAVIGFAPGSPQRTRHPSRNILVRRNRIGGPKTPWLHDRQAQDPNRDRLTVRDNTLARNSG